ncbi:MAG TPA: FAD/NAD(P)-binding oxidoreductase, partial [Saprospiraceae bacterium]|nr:FAD/NAD(P)-binding oxidoreductase [Saprospiraceae bacterium]
MSRYHQILIVGGGNAGISVAAQLLRTQSDLDIAIVEPSEKHFYQPAWTLVGAGEFDINKTVRPQESCMPEKVKWIKDAVTSFQPDDNSLTLANGETVGYEILVVCPGLQIDWDKIEGLKETLGKNEVSCNYSFNHAPYTWEMIKNFKGGKAVFTNPVSPIKCGGAPHKIMYLATHYWQKMGIPYEVHYLSGAGAIFAVKEYAETLNKIVKKRDIHTHYGVNVVSVDGQAKKVFYEEKSA